MLPMHYLHHQSLDLNTWYISIEEVYGDIGISSISAIHFNLDRQTFDAPICPPTSPTSHHPWIWNILVSTRALCQLRHRHQCNRYSAPDEPDVSPHMTSLCPMAWTPELHFSVPTGGVTTDRTRQQAHTVSLVVYVQQLQSTMQEAQGLRHPLP